MKEKLESALNGLLERLEAAETFVLAQAPIVCQEIVKKKMIEIAGEAVAQLVGLVLATILYCFGSGLWAKTVENSDWHQIVGGLAMGGGIILGLIMLFSVMENITGFLVVRMCPKLFLLKELKKLLPSKDE